MFQGWLELQLENDFRKTQMFEHSVKETGKFTLLIFVVAMENDNLLLLTMSPLQKNLCFNL